MRTVARKERHGRTDIYGNRFEILLCLFGMRRTWFSSSVHESGRGGSVAHRQNHLPCGLSVVEGIRTAGARPSVRSQGQAEGSQCGPPGRCPGRHPDGGVVRRKGARLRSESGRGGVHSQTAHVALSGDEREDIWHLSAICVCRGHPCVFGGRGVHGRHRVSAGLWQGCGGDGARHHPRHPLPDGHYCHRGHRHEHVSGQGGHGYCGQAYPCW